MLQFVCTHTQPKKKKKPIGKMNIQPMHGIVLSIVEVDLSMVKADLWQVVKLIAEKRVDENSFN